MSAELRSRGAANARSPSELLTGIPVGQADGNLNSEQLRTQISNKSVFNTNRRRDRQVQAIASGEEAICNADYKTSGTPRTRPAYRQPY